jgi:hypothetical protein
VTEATKPAFERYSALPQTSTSGTLIAPLETKIVRESSHEIRPGRGLVVALTMCRPARRRWA